MSYVRTSSATSTSTQLAVSEHAETAFSRARVAGGANGSGAISLPQSQAEVAKRRRPSRTIFALALATVWVVWGSTFMGIRVMVETIPPLLGSGVRFVIAGAVLAVISAVVSRRNGTSAGMSREEILGAAVIGLLMVGGGVGLFALAEARHMPSSVAALIASSEVAVVLVLRALVGRERVPKLAIVGVLVGLAGVALLLSPAGRPVSVSFAAMLLGVAAAVTWASGTYVGMRVPSGGNLLSRTSVQMLTGGVVLTLAGLVSHEQINLSAISDRSMVAMVGLIAASSAAFMAYGWLLSNASPTAATSNCYVNPVVAVALGALVLGETLPQIALLGMALIMVAVVIALKAEKSIGVTAP